MSEPQIDIRPDHWAIVRDILQRHVPQYAVWAFGSRAKWTAKEYSDLDLAIITESPLPLATSASLAEDFSESDLPWKVDIVDWAETSETFRKIIERDRVVVQEALCSDLTRVNEWPEVSLSQLFKVKHGFAFKGEYFTDEVQDTVLVTPGNFSIGGGFQDEKRKYYRGPIPQDYVLKPGDIVVTMTDLSKESDTLGYAARIPNGEMIWLHNQRVGLLEFNKDFPVSPRFVQYLLRTHEYRAWIVGSATGTTVKHTSPSRIERFVTRIPPIEEQRAIAHILGTLDDRIELNRRMNETLETMARSLFKSWFVDFDGVPAENMQESELGLIPKGWRIGSFGDIADNPRRSVRPEEIEAATPYIALEHMPKRCVALATWGVADGLESHKYKFKRGEILFGKLRPYFHKVGIAPIDGVCSTDIVVIAPKSPAWFSYLLAHSSSDEFVEFTNAGSTGTKMPRTSWPEMSRYAVALPPEAIAVAFDQKIRPMADKIISNIQDSKALTQLRDTLLPKLISGEVRINDAERLAEMA